MDKIVVASCWYLKSVMPVSQGHYSHKLEQLAETWKWSGPGGEGGDGSRFV